MSDVLSGPALARPFAGSELPRHVSGSTVLSEVDGHLLEASLDGIALARLIPHRLKCSNEGGKRCLARMGGPEGKTVLIGPPPASARSGGPRDTVVSSSPGA